MEVCICGGGNISHSFAGELGADKGISVNVLTRRPAEWDTKIDVYYGDEFHHTSQINKVSNDYQILSDADVVFVTIPANARYEYLQKIKDYISPSSILVSAPSTGGINFIFEELFPKNKYVCFQRVPYISRTQVYGHIVKTDLKNEVKAYFSELCTEDDVKLLSDILKMKIVKLSSIYTLFLSNSNPILHIAGMVELLRGDYPYTQNYPLYDVWNDNTSEYALGMDKELESLMKVLKVDDFTNLLVHYGVDSVSGLTQKLKSIPSFKQVMSPLINKNGQYVLDKNSRYIQEDLPFGTCFIKLFTQMNNISTPYIDDAIRKIQPFMNTKFVGEDGYLDVDVLSQYAKIVGHICKNYARV